MLGTLSGPVRPLELGFGGLAGAPVPPPRVSRHRPRHQPPQQPAADTPDARPQSEQAPLPINIILYPPADEGLSDDQQPQEHVASKPQRSSSSQRWQGGAAQRRPQYTCTLAASHAGTGGQPPGPEPDDGDDSGGGKERRAGPHSAHRKPGSRQRRGQQPVDSKQRFTAEQRQQQQEPAGQGTEAAADDARRADAYAKWAHKGKHTQGPQTLGNTVMRLDSLHPSQTVLQEKLMNTLSHLAGARPRRKGYQTIHRSSQWDAISVHTTLRSLHGALQRTITAPHQIQADSSADGGPQAQMAGGVVGGTVGGMVGAAAKEGSPERVRVAALRLLETLMDKQMRTAWAPEHVDASTALRCCMLCLEVAHTLSLGTQQPDLQPHSQPHQAQPQPQQDMSAAAQSADTSSNTHMAIDTHIDIDTEAPTDSDTSQEPSGAVADSEARGPLPDRLQQLAADILLQHLQPTAASTVQQPEGGGADATRHAPAPFVPVTKVVSALGFIQRIDWQADAALMDALLRACLDEPTAPDPHSTQVTYPPHSSERQAPPQQQQQGGDQGLREGQASPPQQQQGGDQGLREGQASPPPQQQGGDQGLREGQAPPPQQQQQVGDQGGSSSPSSLVAEPHQQQGPGPGRRWSNRAERGVALPGALLSLQATLLRRLNAMGYLPSEEWMSAFYTASLPHLERWAGSRQPALQPPQPPSQPQQPLQSAAGGNARASRLAQLDPGTSTAQPQAGLGLVEPPRHALRAQPNRVGVDVGSERSWGVQQGGAVKREGTGHTGQENKGWEPAKDSEQALLRLTYSKLHALAHLTSAAAGLQLTRTRPPPIAWMKALARAVAATHDDAAASFPALRRVAEASAARARKEQPPGSPPRVFYPERYMSDTLTSIMELALCGVRTHGGGGDPAPPAIAHAQPATADPPPTGAMHTLDTFHMDMLGNQWTAFITIPSPIFPNTLPGLHVSTFTPQLVSNPEYRNQPMQAQGYELVPFPHSDTTHGGRKSGRASGQSAKQGAGRQGGGDGGVQQVVGLVDSQWRDGVLPGRRWLRKGWGEVLHSTTLAMLPFLTPGDITRLTDTIIVRGGWRPPQAWWAALLSTVSRARLATWPSWAVLGVLRALAAARYRPPAAWLRDFDSATLPRLGVDFSPAQLASAMSYVCTLRAEPSRDWVGCWYAATEVQGCAEVWTLEQGLEVLVALVHLNEAPPVQWLSALHKRHTQLERAGHVSALAPGRACAWLWAWHRHNLPPPLPSIHTLMEQTLLPRLHELTWSQTCCMIHTLGAIVANTPHERTRRELREYFTPLLYHAAPSLERTVAGDGGGDRGLGLGLALVLSAVVRARVVPPVGWADRWLGAITAAVDSCGEAPLQVLLSTLADGLGRVTRPGEATKQGTAPSQETVRALIARLWHHPLIKQQLPPTRQARRQRGARDGGKAGALVAPAAARPSLASLLQPAFLLRRTFTHATQGLGPKGLGWKRPPSLAWRLKRARVMQLRAVRRKFRTKLRVGAVGLVEDGYLLHEGLAATRLQPALAAH